MQRTGILIAAVLGLTIISGCVGFYTRLFRTGPDDRQGLEEFLFEPRMVSFLNHMGEPDNIDDYNFWVSIKVRDTSIVEPKDINDKNHIAEREAMADRFKERVLSLFRFDSLMIRIGKAGTNPMFLPDTSRYTPRGVNYLSFQFGEAIIPQETDSLRAVFYYEFLGRDGSPPRFDSLVYVMDRYERGESMMGLKELIPARGDIESDE